MTFWRWLFFLIKVGAVALAAAWVAERPGHVSFVWLGYRVDTSIGVLLAILLLLLLVFMILHWLWRLLWRGEPVTRAGEDWTLEEHTIGPLPWTKEGPPVLITAGNRGEMLDASFDRFGRLGDGIITTYLHAEECTIVREHAEAGHPRFLDDGSQECWCTYAFTVV